MLAVNRRIYSLVEWTVFVQYVFFAYIIVRFCTSSFEFGVLTVDPTFSLGEFDVTPITYRHLLLETRRSACIPILLGPVLIHYRKTFSTYLYFASTLVGLNRQLQAVRVFGTDGEQALIDAFAHELSYAQHLTCFIHVRRNIKDKLSSCAVPTNESKKILADIFGRQIGDTFVEGLVDALDDAEFQTKLDSYVKAWQEIAVPSSADMSSFVQWFLRNKVGVLHNTMLRSVREECGLGNPPQQFTTNASESINALLKHKLDYQRRELPVFIEKVKELIDEQGKEIERAVIDRGKYRLRSQYRYLQIEENRWFTMTAQQRSSHLQKVHSIVVSDVHKPDPCGKGTALSASISIEAEAAANTLNLPLTCIEGIWRKAGELLQKQNAIVAAPGQSPEARMVLSYSGKVPHMVTPTKAGGYSCNQNCPNWKSIGLCSQVVAVAELHGKLQGLLSCVQKKKIPSLTHLTTTTMPRGRGRKGGVAPRSRGQVRPEAVMRVSSSAENSLGNCSTHTVTTGHSAAVVAGPGSMQDGVDVHLGVGPPVMPSVYQPQFTNIVQPPFPPVPYYAGTCIPSVAYPNASLTPTLAGPSNPFLLAFITGNIYTCIGCKNKYGKHCQPPDDLCIKHQEWREFMPVGSPSQSKFGNVYYHCKPQCVWLRCPEFIPLQLDARSVLHLLDPVHKAYLSEVFVDCTFLNHL